MERASYSRSLTHYHGREFRSSSYQRELLLCSVTASEHWAIEYWADLSWSSSKQHHCRQRNGLQFRIGTCSIGIGSIESDGDSDDPCADEQYFRIPC